jgi:hypothetical protein
MAIKTQMTRSFSYIGWVAPVLLIYLSDDLRQIIDRADELHGKHTLFGRCVGDTVYSEYIMDSRDS